MSATYELLLSGCGISLLLLTLVVLGARFLAQLRMNDTPHAAEKADACERPLVGRRVGPSPQLISSWPQRSAAKAVPSRMVAHSDGPMTTLGTVAVITRGTRQWPCPHRRRPGRRIPQRIKIPGEATVGPAAHVFNLARGDTPSAKNPRPCGLGFCLWS